MKNKLLLSLIVSLFAVSAWAADVSVTEKFTQVKKPGTDINTTTTADGLIRFGDVCGWNFQKLRYTTDYITVGSTNVTAVWLNKVSNTEYSELATTNLEGGIKAVSFRWAQFGKETGNTLKLKVAAGAIEHNPAITRDGSSGADYSTGGTEYTHSFECKTNGQLVITNVSEKTGNACRILVCNIAITPYLLYRNKDVTIGLKQRGYVNNSKQDFINNTDSEGTISYSSSNEGVATIDANGVVTPVGVGNAVITATWSEGASTTYTLHVVDGIIAENFSKVVQTGQTTGATWHGDLFAWEVANVRRGVDDTLGINPRIQATALRTNTGSSLVTKEVVEGGVKHVTFDWRQWASGTTPLTIDMYYSADKENWGEAVAKQSVDAVGAAEPHVFNEDIDNGAKGNAYLKLNYTSTKGVAVLGALKITPWLLYTTKEATLDTRGNGAMSYKNLGLIDNTTGDAPSYSITNYDGISNEILLIKADDGTVSVTDRYQTGNITVQAEWSGVTTTYTLHVIGKADPNAHFAESEKTVDISIMGFSNTLSKAEGSGDASYESSNPSVAEVTETGSITINGVGTTIIKATIEENDNFQEAVVSYTLNVTATTVAWYQQKNVRVGLGESVYNTLNYTYGYQGTITYNSSNPAVATVNEEGVVSLVGAVGQTTITATLPDYGGYTATSASYNLYVRDNSARKEGFKDISGVGVLEGDDFDEWKGDLYTWERQYQVRRTNNDTIHAGAGKHQATSIGIQDPTGAPKSSILRTKGVIEGGIKYLSFYWMQWGSAGEGTRRIAVYADDNLIGYGENPNGTSGRTGDEFMLGINNAMKSNKQLVIKNESYKGSVGTLSNFDKCSRICLDSIYITPWLLYTNKDEQVMRVGDTYTREPNINNTEGESGTLSYESSDPTVASVNAEGTVKAIARGKVIITAKYQWNENEVVTTTYPVAVYPVNCETFSNGATASTYAANEESAAGDKATWRARLAGITAGDFEANVAFIRAPRQNEDKEAYLESSAIAGGIASMSFDWNLVAGETTTNWDIRILINGREVKRLGNDDLATAKMENFAQITIPAINEPDNFTIRFENHSTVNGTYTTGNKARFVIDNICWESYSGTKTLAEDTDNEGWIRANGGQTVDVTISRSALVEGVWNTLCLPFAISKASDLDDAEVKEMTSVAMEGEVLNIYFSDIAGDELQAGKPYLVKPAADKIISGTYNNKQISSIASPVKYGDVTMQGMFSPVAVTKDDYNTLFVGSPDGEGNNLFYPKKDGTLRGLRAYFKIGGAPLPAPRRARYVINQKDVETGIESVQNSDVRIQKIIRDGQLFIIRDGKMYNAQGQVIK